MTPEDSADAKVDAATEETAETPQEADAATEVAAEDQPEATEEPADVAADQTEAAEDAIEPQPDEPADLQAEETSEAADPEPEEEQSRPQEEAAIPAPPPSAPERRSAWPMIIAGILIAALGYIAGRGDAIDRILPAAWRAPDPTAEIAPQIAELATQTGTVSEELGALTAKVEAIPAPQEPNFAPIVNQIQELRGRVQTLEDTPAPAPIITTDGTDLSPINTALQQLGDRLTDLEQQDQDYASEFEALQATAKDQQEQIAALLDANQRAETEAEAAANETRAREALGRIRAALDSGQPFASDLDAFAETGLAEVPATLRDVAADGVTTLGALQISVDDAARNALAAARAAESDTSGPLGFFERQLGIRSLEAREGDDPDAVLSRVVANMKNGDLEQALTEAESLPEAARDAMSGWLTNAQTRANALTAAAGLSASLPTN